MKQSIKTGFSFGITSGIITTLGLIIGLSEGTNSKLAVIGGILTIAIADSLSDSLGIHISEEAENKHTTLEIWISTITTFLTKLFFTLTFAIPVILFSLDLAIMISIFWGTLLLTIFSFYLARQNKEKPLAVIFEHLMVCVLVIVATYLIGNFINTRFV